MSSMKYVRSNPKWSWAEPRLQSKTFKLYPIYHLSAWLKGQNGQMYSLTATVKCGLYDAFVEGVAAISEEVIRDDRHDLEWIDTHIIPMWPIDKGETNEETVENAKQYMELKAAELLFTPMELLTLDLK